MLITSKLKLFSILVLLFALTLIMVACAPGPLGPINYTLTINTEGEGGVIPSEGTHEYEENTVVDLEAVPDEGFEFYEWEGDVAEPEKPETTIAMDGDKEVTAIFERMEHDLNIEVEGEGHVEKEIVYEPEDSYEHGTVLQLTTVPDENKGFGFNQWSGDIGNDIEEKDKFKNVIEIEIDEKKNITATFKEISLSGIVLENRGGSAVSEATITAYEEDTKKIAGLAQTDEHGEFSHALPSGTYDILAEKNDYAASIVCSVDTDENFDIGASIIMKEVFDESEEAVAPEIEVIGIENGDVIDEPVEIEINASAEYPIERIEIRLGHQDIYREVIEQPYEESFSEEGILSPDELPAGEGFLEISLYDTQHNRAARLIPVEVKGEGNVDLDKIDIVSPWAITFGQDLGLFVEKQKELTVQQEHFENFEYLKEPGVLEGPDGREIDLTDISLHAREDITLFVDLEWSYVAEADSYYVYRSWEEDGSWEHIATVANNWLNDFDGELRPGRETYYKVAPVGPDGKKGPESDPVMVTPLEQFEVLLESPENEAQDVSLEPTLEWDANSIGEKQWYYGWVVGSTDDYPSWFIEEEGVTEVDYNYDGFGEELQPQKEYRWDIEYAEAAREFSNYENSLAISIAGAGTGSSNGEFTFVTGE